MVLKKSELSRDEQARSLEQLSECEWYLNNLEPKVQLRKTRQCVKGILT